MRHSPRDAKPAPLPATRVSEAAYGAALTRLYQRRRGARPRDPERVRRLLAALGIGMPPHTVHVVGTNGKGSVAARVEAGLRAAGRRTGLFTSPHVEAFEERVRVDGTPVTPTGVLGFLRRLERDEPAADPAAFFEASAALALDAFERAGSDWAVLEAGVGAARDATAVLENVRAVIITNVAMDHTGVLGTDLRSIARDKAAAVRPGVPVVTAARGPALEEIARVASERRSPLFLDVGTAPLFRVEVGGAPDPARHANARLAAATLRLLEVPEAAVSAAMAAPPLPARRETFEVAGRHVLLDGAHNPAAASTLAESLEPGFDLLLGAHARKRPHALLAPLEPRARHVHLTVASEGERPWGDDARFEPDPLRALGTVLDSLPPQGRLVVTGSLYLAGRLRPWLRRHARARALSPTDRGAP